MAFRFSPLNPALLQTGPAQGPGKAISHAFMQARSMANQLAESKRAALINEAMRERVQAEAERSNVVGEEFNQFKEEAAQAEAARAAAAAGLQAGLPLTIDPTTRAEGESNLLAANIDIQQPSNYRLEGPGAIAPQTQLPQAPDALQMPKAQPPGLGMGGLSMNLPQPPAPQVSIERDAGRLSRDGQDLGVYDPSRSTMERTEALKAKLAAQHAGAASMDRAASAQAQRMAPGALAGQGFDVAAAGKELQGGLDKRLDREHSDMRTAQLAASKTGAGSPMEIREANVHISSFGRKIRYHGISDMVQSYVDADEGIKDVLIDRTNKPAWTKLIYAAAVSREPGGKLSDADVKMVEGEKYKSMMHHIKTWGAREFDGEIDDKTFNDVLATVRLVRLHNAKKMVRIHDALAADVERHNPANPEATDPNGLAYNTNLSMLQTMFVNAPFMKDDDAPKGYKRRPPGGGGGGGSGASLRAKGLAIKKAEETKLGKDLFK